MLTNKTLRWSSRTEWSLHIKLIAVWLNISAKSSCKAKFSRGWATTACPIPPQEILLRRLLFLASSRAVSHQTWIQRLAESPSQCWRAQDHFLRAEVTEAQGKLSTALRQLREVVHLPWAVAQVTHYGDFHSYFSRVAQFSRLLRGFYVLQIWVMYFQVAAKWWCF